MVNNSDVFEATFFQPADQGCRRGNEPDITHLGIAITGHQHLVGTAINDQRLQHQLTAISELIPKLKDINTSKITGLGKELILKGTMEEINELKYIIEKFDRPKKQIQIKATIIDTSDNLFERLGVDFSAGKNNDNKAKEVLATKAPTTPPPQAQPSHGATTQQPKNTPTPPKAEPPKQAKTAQQQPLQTKPTPPTPPRPTTQDRAEDKAPVKPPQQAQEQQKPLTAYDRPINQYYDILATHKRSFAKQNDISTVKKLYPSDEPIYLNFANDKGSISLNKGKQKTDLHFEIYKRFREVADKTTSEIKRTSELVKNYMTLTVNQFTARYNIELTDADKKDIESKDRLLKIDDFKNNYVEKEK